MPLFTITIWPVIRRQPIQKPQMNIRCTHVSCWDLKKLTNCNICITLQEGNRREDSEVNPRKGFGLRIYPNTRISNVPHGGSVADNWNGFRQISEKKSIVLIFLGGIRLQTE